MRIPPRGTHHRQSCSILKLMRSTCGSLILGWLTTGFRKIPTLATMLKLLDVKTSANLSDHALHMGTLKWSPPTPPQGAKQGFRVGKSLYF